MEEPLQIALPPGVVKNQSLIASKGRYVDCDAIRFWKGLPQKVGGRARQTATPVSGVARGLLAWSNLTLEQFIAIGTTQQLFVTENADFLLADVTPIVLTGSLTNPFTTTNGSATVRVAWAANGAVSGQWVNFSGATAVGGLTLNGSFQIQTIIDSGDFTILAPAAASSSASGGGSVTANLELPPGIVDPVGGYGWGAGAWNAGAYGTARAATGILYTPRFWSLDHFGRILIAAPLGGSIYSFDPNTTPVVPAAIVTAAPQICTGVVVTSDLIVIAYGTNFNSAGPPYNTGTQDFMQWWASAQGDYTNWDTTQVSGPNGTPSVTGRLQSGTEIVAGADLGIHVTLLWTDTSLYAFQYTGSQFVFNIERVGKECGLLGPLAFTVVDTVAYWMSNNRFYLYAGGVQDIPNQQDILDFVFGQIPMSFGIKSVCVYNPQYREIWFYFVGAGQTEPNTYVIYNIDGQFWTVGYSLQATCATRFTGADPRPLVMQVDGYLYETEIGLDNNGAAINWFLQTSPLELGEGERLYTAQSIAMDMQRQVGSVTATMTAYDRTPALATTIDAATAVFAPTDNRQDFRITGRLVNIKWSSSGIGCDVRFGVPKVLITTSGRRQ